MKKFQLINSNYHHLTHFYTLMFWFRLHGILNFCLHNIHQIRSHADKEFIQFIQLYLYWLSDLYFLRTSILRLIIVKKSFVMYLSVIIKTISFFLWSYEIKEPEDKFWGAADENGTWSGMIRQLIRKVVYCNINRCSGHGDLCLCATRAILDITDVMEVMNTEHFIFYFGCELWM